jgi:hypothetical protein
VLSAWTSSAISRSESGRTSPAFTTLERLAVAPEVELVVGFETDADDRELVSVWQACASADLDQIAPELQSDSAQSRRR